MFDIGRHCGVVQVQSFYNYGPLTVALAVNYMDRFLSRHHLPVSRGFGNILFTCRFCVWGVGDWGWHRESELAIVCVAARERLDAAASVRGVHIAGREDGGI